MPLIAETDPATYIGVGAAITALIGAMVGGTIKIINARNKSSAEVREWTALKAKELIEDLQKEVRDLKRERDGDRRIHQRCLRWQAVVTAWFRFSAAALRAANMDPPNFKDLVEDDELPPSPEVKP